MSKIDSNEFYIANESNSFNEFKFFKAEEYYVKENKNDAKEILDIEESFQVKDSVRKDNKVSKSKRDLRREIERSTNNSNPTSSSSSSGTTASTGANSVAESSIIVSGSTAGVAITAAAVIITSLGPSIVLPAIDKYITNNYGCDYATFNVDFDEILSAYTKDFAVSESDFVFRVYDDDFYNKEVHLEEGNKTYLLGSMKPKTTYTYQIDCLNESIGDEKTIFKSSFTTLENDYPKGVKDELNTKLSFDDDSQSATLNYSLYISDYENIYSPYTFYVSTEEETDPNDIKYSIYSSSNLNNDNFFVEEINGLINEDLYIYVVGESLNDDGTEYCFLYQDSLKIEYPPYYDRTFYSFDVIESEEVDFSNDLEIKIMGKLNKVEQQYPFHVKFNQYNESGECIVDSLEGRIFIDEMNLFYDLATDVYFDTKKYDYTIYMIDENNEYIEVYKSPIKHYSITRKFDATYNKVEPTDAKITYNENSIDIFVETNFQSGDDIYFYNLKVVNSVGTIYGEYTGTNNASINIRDLDGLDEIFFIYSDCGRYFDKEVIFETYNSSGRVFDYPRFYLSNEIKIMDGIYVLNYSFDTLYNYYDCKVTLELTINGTKHEFLVGPIDYGDEIVPVNSHGEIYLYDIYGEYYNVEVVADIEFIDNESSNEIKHIRTQLESINLIYELNIERAEADIYGTNGTTYEASLLFKMLPPGYRVHVVDANNALDFYIDEPYIDYYIQLNIGTMYNFETSLVDEFSEFIRNGPTIVFDDTRARNEFVDFYASYENPGSAAVSFNDDQTVNIYREVIPEFDPDGKENVVAPSSFLNAALFTNLEQNPDDGKIIWGQRIDSILQNRYSIIENIPSENYSCMYFKYHLMDNVYYVMDKSWPSGTIITMYDSAVTCYYNVLGETTNIAIESSSYGEFENRVIINGQTYQFNNYEPEKYYGLQVVINEAIDVTSVVVFFSTQFYYYDQMINSINLKGNKYKTVDVTNINRIDA